MWNENLNINRQCETQYEIPNATLKFFFVDSRKHS